MDELIAIVARSEWFLGVLRVVRDTGLPDAWVGAGALRDLVWGERYGSGFRPAEVRDVDVAFFDPGDLSRARDRAATELLAARDAAVPWEATNQAAVHTWYHEMFPGDRDGDGGPVEPLVSTADGVATWPETATAVAVRLDAGERLRVCAPLGVDDLLNGIWRRNPRRVGITGWRARSTRLQPQRRWPGVRVIEP